MGAQTTFVTPAMAAINAANVREAVAMSNRSYELAVALQESSGAYRQTQLRAYVELLEAVRDHMRCDDINEAIQTAREEAGLAPDDYRFPRREWVEAAAMGAAR